ncbi:hypothetical protein TUZN_0660 [Thermoproteus uzoniensis 768-20]|uniref:Uncharacterized protein n=1 Tax=Thermoproteus uzoniensis (strain 768-20) TaxID=999630 RepID=F2L496_THEU7|nr:hypothetical protein [Thermoproteus uzoniensis]AEA12152.1 hypothetical protein TUZN_0660 [Thermoproteus uzoniensis 768-20]
MIVYTDQLDLLRKVLQILGAKRAEPLVIRGEGVDFVWPPRAPDLPIDLLEIMPTGTYVILRGNTITLVP